MRLLLFTLITVFTVSTFAQAVPKSFKNPKGELKVLFVSIYKIKTIRTTTVNNTPTGEKATASPRQKVANSTHKKLTTSGSHVSGTYHKTDKSMLDDNQLLLEEWYNLLKARLDRMGVPAPENYEYINMQDPAKGVVETQEKLKGANQWLMITCNDLSKAQKAMKKGNLTLESFGNVAISIQNTKGEIYTKNGKNLAAILDKVEKAL